MSNGQNPNGVSPNVIGDVIRKNLQVHPAVALGPESWQFGVVSDPLNGATNLFFQSNAKTGFNFLIVCNGLVEFNFRLLENFELHAGKRRSKSAKT